MRGLILPTLSELFDLIAQFLPMLNNYTILPNTMFIEISPVEFFRPFLKSYAVGDHPSLVGPLLYLNAL